MKHCQLGDHLTFKLWRSRTKTSPSACKNCYQKENPSPLKRTSLKALNEASRPKKPTPKEEKSISELIKLAAIVVHRLVKKRDSHNGYFYCIACGKLKPISEMQAGHFMASTYAYTRFNLLNINAECIQCNCFDPDHLIGYRKNLIDKIGLKAVEQLEIDAHKPHKWDRQELLDLIKKYK